MLACIGIVSIWTPLMLPRIATRWFTLPDFYWLSQIPLATLVVAWLCWRGLRKGHALQPFIAAIGLFLLAYIGLLISNVPYLVPPSMTIQDAASAPASQQFLLMGTVFLLPVIIGYTVFVYWVFRGKVGEGYH